MKNDEKFSPAYSFWESRNWKWLKISTTGFLTIPLFGLTVGDLHKSHLLFWSSRTQHLHKWSRTIEYGRRIRSIDLYSLYNIYIFYISFYQGFISVRCFIVISLWMVLCSTNEARLCKVHRVSRTNMVM